MSRTRAADYVSLLIEHLRMREAHVGYDFAFGHKREGTVDFLRQSGAERGFAVRVIDPLTNGGESISSTSIRQALRAGDVQTAARWLGRPFRLSGAVTRQAGHVAALDVWPEHAIPADGAYTCQAWVGNLKFDATAAIGARRIDDALRRSVEVSLPGVDRNLEGKNVALDFIAPANQPSN
jgi:riboflavin kinase/FMN adenylyltransferase